MKSLMRTLIIITILLWVDNSMAQIVDPNPIRFLDAFGNKIGSDGFEAATGIYDFNKQADRTEAANKGFYKTGEAAVDLAKSTFDRELSPQEKLLIKHEGFTTVPYLDTENIPTIGIGQTGQYFDPLDIQTGFEEAVADKTNAVKEEFDDAYNLADDTKQGALLSLVYRGDTRNKNTGNLYQWVGKYKKAVDSGKKADMNKAFEEFWDNKEYKDLMVDDPDGGVLTRIRENSNILFGKTK